MSHRRSFPALVALVALVAGAAVGCGPSEEEYKAKLSEIESLKGQLDEFAQEVVDLLGGGGVGEKADPFEHAWETV